jgi:hypothetical protein
MNDATIYLQLHSRVSRDESRDEFHGSSIISEVEQRMKCKAECIHYTYCTNPRSLTQIFKITTDKETAVMITLTYGDHLCKNPHG